MRQRILLVVVTGLALLVPAAVASADSTQFTTVEAPAELLNGSPGPALDKIKDLGAQGVRIQLAWADVAPAAGANRTPSFNATDPNAYPASGWARYDAAIDGARQRGLKVQLTVTGPAPRWATQGGRDAAGLTRPSATGFGKFATAVGRRYGRSVSWWSIWNEPNLGKLLKPIFDGSSNRYASPTIYRDLYGKAYSGLRSAGVRAPILIGELAPQRNPMRDNGTVAPLAFLREMLCLDGHYQRKRGTRCAKVPTQGFAMHPYSTAAGPFLTPADADNITIGVLSRLSTALDRAARAGAIAAGLPIYITEFGVQSYPDRLGVPLPVQSDYRSIAEYLSYGNRRVKSFSQYLLRDDENATGRAYGSFESGLYLFKGDRPKPALYSFRLPLVVVAAKGSTTRATLWGLVRPGKSGRRSGSITIDYQDAGKPWKKLGTQRFGTTGYWKRSVTTNRNRGFRVTWKAPDGKTYVGPKTVARAAAPTA